MSFISLTDAEYIVKMYKLAEEGRLQSNRICHDCDEQFYEGEMLKAERDHTVARYDDALVPAGRSWSLIIGCGGYHEMNDKGYPKYDDLNLTLEERGEMK